MKTKSIFTRYSVIRIVKQGYTPYLQMLTGKAEKKTKRPIIE